MLGLKIQVFFRLYYIDHLLKKRGLRETCELMKEKKLNSKSQKNSENIESLYLKCTQIDRTCSRHFLKKRALCLHKSLVGYQLLCKNEPSIYLCVGVAKKDFMAHAWLEKDGKVINDTQDVKDTHNILYTI
ncbi:lasso peptide biosynthesis B2 protein [Bacillus sp. NTK074B]|uniref:lasso peptide biosynthesis B2 protein n=1 Tax=Bacillus sp. NTK074B TaxID=2802174 RepID=UPI001A8F1BC6|nr:lasso peptide biosynthesis B2 protein [Bacillus sp. NTK074B]